MRAAEARTPDRPAATAGDVMVINGALDRDPVTWDIYHRFIAVTYAPQACRGDSIMLLRAVAMSGFPALLGDVGVHSCSD
ncbi:hypothetical protein MHYP_G00121950 [Metynnis hypsauchen]